MTTEGVKRKLSAILSADVKDYSRLMRDDEAATIRTLNAYREGMTKLIQQHHGRVVDSPGDNLLAEFASVVGGLGIWYVIDFLIVLFGEFTDSEGKKIRDWI